MTKLELLNNEKQATKNAMKNATGAELSKLADHLEYLNEKEIDLREDAEMNGESDEAELEMYDDDSFSFSFKG